MHRIQRYIADRSRNLVRYLGQLLIGPAVEDVGDLFLLRRDGGRLPTGSRYGTDAAPSVTEPRVRLIRVENRSRVMTPWG